jgi:hypothetical protein
MKVLKTIAAIIFMGSFAYAGICDDPLRQKEICMEMKHLRSEILVLGAQRDLLQVNYPYLQQIGLEIQGVSKRVKDRIINSDPEHATGLVGIEGLSAQLVDSSSKNLAEALVISNNIQNQCANCHSKENPASDIKWDDIFKNDWSVFYAKCNQPDRNPYTCKSMHGMLSSISTFFTASQLGVENFEVTKLGALEIERLSKDLTQKQFIHGGEVALSLIGMNAKEVATLAEQKNPEAFTKAVAITQVCMQCHADRPDMLSKPLTFKKL